MPRKPGGQDSRQITPAATPEGRESQLVSLAMDLAERRLREGTATSQEVTHFLKLGSSRERLEQERLEHENELTAARIANIESAQRVEELYKEAIFAMRAYAGHESLESSDYYED